MTIIVQKNKQFLLLLFFFIFILCGQNNTLSRVFPKTVLAESISPTNTNQPDSKWIKYAYNPILSPSEPWEKNSVSEPTVLYEDNTFKMWYSGAACAVGYATSTDGITWEKYSNNPVLGFGKGGERNTACQNNVIKFKGKYYLYYIDNNRDMYVAVSDNGIDFVKHKTPILKHIPGTWENSLANSYIWVEGDKWHMIYEAQGSDGLSLWRMGVAEGEGPYIWKRDANNPLTSIQIGKGMYGGPWVKKIGSIYYLWHHASLPADNLPTDIYLHASKDLHHWIPTQNSPLIGRTQPNWEIDQVADPSVVQVNNKSYIFYDGDLNVGTYEAWIGLVYYDGPIIDTLDKNIEKKLPDIAPASNSSQKENKDSTNLIKVLIDYLKMKIGNQ